MAEEDKRPDGFFGRLFRPWKRQRVTLTRPGAKQAPLRRGSKSTPDGTGSKESPAPPTTPNKRAVKELRALLAIGKRDPERLAGIISRMLRDEMEKENEARLRFERLIWEKAEGRKPPRDPES